MILDVSLRRIRNADAVQLDEEADLEAAIPLRAVRNHPILTDEI
jgi:hypothetical protein